MAQLPRLAALGVNTIELMPVNDFAGSRNWGYDGVLPYAPDETYGTPDDLKALVDAAHGHGLAVMLDVVYNHFGPSGNYWHSIAPDFFRKDVSTPWGDAIDFRETPVRDFFIENAIFWLTEYRFDGLRLDAVHAIPDASFLPELSRRVREAAGSRRVYLVLENENNDATLLEHDFDAQWNDDAHHCLHVLLTGETDAYYADYADRPAGHRPARWRRASSTRARNRPISAMRAASRAATCRPRPSSMRCRTTTRWATVPSATASTPWPLPMRCAPRCC
ncbi:alpha-amylase family glycosyl hydrolase [Teichococcus aestuarii]|uniref:alpha-amylase family glycosyl hydrolase n=1 Tax=Teichococcus aestuarii TaxID=568898 RepID=UPI0036191544